MTARPIVILDVDGSTLDVPQGTDTYLCETDLKVDGTLHPTGKIISVSNANIDIEPNGTGNVLLGNFTFNADQTIGAGQDNMVMTYDHAAGTIGLETPAGGTEPFYGTIYIETVANQDYELSFDMPFAGTVTTLRTKSQSGTCTVTGKIGTTALGGTANSASSVASEQAHSSANTWVKGNTLKVTISANSACTDLEIAWMGTMT